MLKQLIAGLVLVALTCAVQAQNDEAKKDDAAGESKPKAEAATEAKADEANPADAKPSPFKTNKEKASYFIGLSIGKNLQRQGMIVDPETFAKGLADALSNAEPKVTLEEARPALMAMEEEAMKRAQALQEEEAAAAAKVAEANRAEGKAFLAKNAEEEGVKTTESGLQYKVLTEGSGKKPAASDSVRVHYRGTLLDGTEFDSSYKRGQPATFGVTQVIKGWVEALQLMKVGGKWKLWIPADLAYGDTPRPGGPIKPGHLLVFEVELLGIE